MKQSKFLSINWNDIFKSFIVAFLTFLAYFVQDELLPSLNISTELKVMFSTAIGYLVKNFLTPSKEEINK